ncbi:uncharacterized protein LOC141536036 [Cotesia typhae]|uniref:uncharacterized protein LOC141536036 n=1 Tax=Cotesia typhae TaxID=2053667 RepID=UPI003D683B8F
MAQCLTFLRLQVIKPRNQLSVSVTPKISSTPGNADTPVFIFNSLRPESALRQRKVGRLTIAERLQKLQNQSSGSLEDIFRNLSNNKRTREPELGTSPPHKQKQRRSSSSPPSTRVSKSPIHVSTKYTTPNKSDMSDTEECKSVFELHKQLRSWRDEDSKKLELWNSEISKQLEEVKSSNAALSQIMKDDFDAEKKVVHSELSVIKARWDAIEN